MKEQGKFNGWPFIGDMSMERKLLLVFLVIVTLPLSIIGIISYKSYSESIEANTVAYSEKLIDQMMDGIDDYIEDMKRISSMPAYVNEIKQNLIASNRYHEQKSRGEGDTGSRTVAPGDFDLLLSIQRGIEGNISFINNIKRGTNSVPIFLTLMETVIILQRTAVSGWTLIRATNSGAGRRGIPVVKPCSLAPRPILLTFRVHVMPIL